MEHGTFFKLYNAHAKNRIRLVVLPYAGGTASVFKDWAEYCAPEIALCTVQLPGREERFEEPLYYSLDSLIEDLGIQMRQLDDLPYAFFGHSLGALLAYELAGFLARTGARLPSYVFLSGAYPPGQEPPVPPDYLNLSESDAVEKLGMLQSMPDEITGDPELLRLLLPIFKADFSLMESFHKKRSYRFSMPVTVFGGVSDSAVPVRGLYQWQEFAEAYCKIITMAGDHFFIFPEKEKLLAEINRELRFLSVIK